MHHQQDISIDRGTVLKINRLSTVRNLHKRDHSWPPPHSNEINYGEKQRQQQNAVELRSTSSDNVIHFDENVCRRHGIDAICKKFNSPTRIIEPTAKEVRQRRQILKNKSMHDNNKHSSSTQIHHANDYDGIKLHQIADKNLKLIVQQKGFSAPETQAAHEIIGLVEPKRSYYEKLAITNHNNNNNNNAKDENENENERCSSCDFIANNMQLPPLKPRSVSTCGVSTISSNHNRTPKLQRRSIKLATEIQICYDADVKAAKTIQKTLEPQTLTQQQQQQQQPMTSQSNVTTAAVSHMHNYVGAAFIINNNNGDDDADADDNDVNSVDLEAIPLPAPPTKTVKNTKCANNIGAFLHEDFSCNANSVRPTTQVLQYNKKAKAIPHFDNDCIFLHSNDLLDNTVAHIPAASMSSEPPPTYVSRLPTMPLEGIKLQAKVALPKINCKLQDEQQFYTDGKYVYGPQRLPVKSEIKSAQVQKQETVAEVVTDMKNIKRVTEKYEEIQESIAEHLRQIDTYMKNAKLALHETLKNHNDEGGENMTMEIELWPKNAQKINVIVETPLQMILKQFDPKCSSNDNSNLHASQPNQPIENMPVIEQALTELELIAKTVDDFEAKGILLNPTPNQMGVNELILDLKSLPVPDLPQNVLIAEAEEEDNSDADLDVDVNVECNELKNQVEVVEISSECNSNNHDTNKQSCSPQNEADETKGALKNQETQSNEAIRKYPAALPEPHVYTRAASPFGLNVVDDNYSQLCYTIPPIPPPPPPPLPPLTPQVMSNAGMIKVTDKNICKKQNNVATIVSELEQLSTRTSSSSSSASTSLLSLTTTSLIPIMRETSIKTGFAPSTTTTTTTTTIWSTTNEPVVQACEQITTTTTTAINLKKIETPRVAISSSLHQQLQQFDMKGEKIQNDYSNNNDSSSNSNASFVECHAINCRSFDNVSPRPYITIEGIVLFVLSLYAFCCCHYV